MEKVNIFLSVDETAEAYATRTLYRYLKKIKFEERNNAKIYFYGSDYYGILKGMPFSEPTREDVVVVRVYSDISKRELDSLFNLGIDISILKNCMLPMRDDEKENIRKRYAMKTKTPLVVVSYCNRATHTTLEELAERLSPVSEVFMVDLCSEIKNVSSGKIYGNLRKYYAMADATINAKNLTECNSFLHNFVEATESGPLFMVPPTSEKQKQYGYKELVEIGAIRECRNKNDLFARLFRYLNRPIERIIESKEEHRRKREKHILRTRERYLPIIENFLERIISEQRVMFADNLVIKTSHLISHEDSDWGD